MRLTGPTVDTASDIADRVCKCTAVFEDSGDRGYGTFMLAAFGAAIFRFGEEELELRDGVGLNLRVGLLILWTGL